MATSDFLPFASTDTGTNLLTQAEYLADTQRQIGNQSGVARAKLVNKVLRQSSFISAAVAKYVSDTSTVDVLDDEDLAGLAVELANAILATANSSTSLVHKAGYETISGVKEFTSNPLASNATEANIKLAKTGTGASVFYPYNRDVQLGLADTVMGIIAYMNKALPTDFIINKNLYVAGNIISTAGVGVGYGTGSGGTVTQLISKGNPVTLNKPSGRIVTHNASLAPGATVVFQVNNSLILTTETANVILVDNANYDVKSVWNTNGAFTIKVTNTTGSTLAEVLNIHFNIMKGAIA